MKPAPPDAVTFAQWLAVLAIWGLATYGACASPTPTAPAPIRLAACR